MHKKCIEFMLVASCVAALLYNSVQSFMLFPLSHEYYACWIHGMRKKHSYRLGRTSSKI